MKELIKHIKEKNLQTCDATWKSCDLLNRQSDIVIQFDTLIKAVHLTRLNFISGIKMENMDLVDENYLEEHRILAKITKRYLEGEKIVHEHTPLVELMLTDGMVMNTPYGEMVFDERILLS